MKRYKNKDDTQIDTQTYLALAAIIILLFVLMFIVTNLEGYMRESRDQLEVHEYKDLKRTKEIETIERDGTENDFNLVVEDGYKIEDALKQSKIPYKVIKSLKDIKSFEDNLILDGTMIKDKEDFDIIQKFISEKRNIIFLDAPELKSFEKFDLESILGINKLHGKDTQDELKLVPGFMLGGIHEFEDLSYDSLVVDLLYSTKVYAHGHEDSPVIWRNTIQDSEIYVLNGELMETNASYGILSSIMSEIYEDYIYPIINTRFMTYEGFPFISHENEENLNKLYNRDAMRFQYDIVMPNILTMNNRRDFIPNGYFALGFEGRSTEDVSEHNINQVNNIKSQIYTSGGDVNLKYTGDFKRDKQIYNKVFEDEKITSVMMDEELTSLKDILNASDSLESIIGPWGDRNTFEYLNDDVVYIPFTASGIEFTSRDKLEFLSAVTAFGAIVETLSLEELVLNQDDKENWTQISKKYSRFIDDYRGSFDFLESRNTQSATRVLFI